MGFTPASKQTVRDQSHEVQEPTQPTEFEMQAYLWNELRALGAIEQDADVVMFVHRPIQVKPDLGEEWRHYAKLSVAKNRQGRCGVVSLFYQGDQTRFDGWGGEVPRHVKAQPALRRGFAAGDPI